MHTGDRRVLDRAQQAEQSYRPGLDVTITAVESDTAVESGEPRPSVHVRLRGVAEPVRLHLYVDGDLMESWMPAPETVTVDLRSVAVGHHAVTARAIDSTGRWGGASMLVVVPRS
jgi:hypothetical protein